MMIVEVLVLYSILELECHPVSRSICLDINFILYTTAQFYVTFFVFLKFDATVRVERAFVSHQVQPSSS